MASEAQLQADLHAAMKARQMDKVYVLRDVIAAIKNLKVDKMLPELGEADVVALLRKEVSKRTEAAEFAQKANRPELVAKNEGEKALLEAYLPSQIAPAQLEEIIRGLAAELGSTQIGPLMAKLRERHAGRFDGKLASEIIRKLG